MPGRSFHWAVLCCIGSLLPALFPVPTSGEGNAPNSKPPRSTTETPHFVAVMGEVKSGGVFAFSSDGPTLRELIHRSGGLTPQAGGSIRILRNGRTILNVPAASGRAMRLRPGDVVLVSRETQQGSRVTRHGQSGVITAAPVEVALLNLIQRPVVLRLRSRHANLPTLLRLLGQSPDMAPYIRIIGSRGSVSLKNGSVLVFDPRFVQLSRIPPLPKPVFPQISSQVKSNDKIALPISQPRDGSIRLIQGSKKPASATRRADIRTLTTVPPPELRGNAGQATTGPLSRYLPPLPGDPTTSSPVRVAEKTAAAGISAAPNRASVPPPDAGSSPDNDADLVLKAGLSEKSGEKEAGIDMVTMTIMFFAAFGVLVAAGLLVSMGRRAVSGQSKTGNRSQHHRSRLDQLISNEIQIVEETVAIPIGQTFFGQAAGPQMLRLDEEHATGHLFQPHISERSKPVPVREESKPDQSVQRTDGPEPLSRSSEPQRASQSMERTRMHAPPAYEGDRR